MRNIVTALGIGKIISATMNTIKSSISSAMDRIDTMNQFTRVMTAMTGSTKKADEALASIKKTVTGTAYGLDIASKSTQKLVTSGMDLKKSTKQIQTWADAVAFYGDGTNATFEGVTDALAKMVAKGKVEMDQLNRLTDVGIPAVQIYADMLGRSVSEVQDDLSKGRISAEEFLDGLDKAFNDGTNKFASITGAAQEAGSSWTATFDNFKAAITRGMTNVINAIDDGLKLIGLKTMREMIADIGEKAEELLKGIAEKLPNIISFLEKILPLIIGIIAGLTAYKIILLAIQAVQFVQGIIGTMSAFMSLIPVIKSVKDAMLLLNMTFAVNPITLIAIAIAALIAILVVLYNKSETFRNSINKAFETIKNSIIKAWEKIKPALERLGETFGKLLEKLKPVGNFLVQGLGKAFEILGNILAFIIDILAQVIVWFVDFVDSSIEFWTQTVPNAIQEFINFISQLPQKIWDFLVNGWNSIVSFFTEGIPNFINSIIQWFQELPMKIANQIGEMLGSIIKFGIDVGNWVTTELPQIIQNIINWFAQLPGRIWEWLCSVVSNIITWGQDMWNNAVTAVSNMINGIINWFAQLPGRIWTWLVNTINNVINWGRDMANKGKEGAENLSNNIVNTVKELPNKMLEIGKNIVEGIWNGITGMGNWIGDKVSGFFGGIVDGAKKSLGIQSPSRVFRDKVGKFIPQGLAIGIEADTDKAIKAVDNMNDEIYSKMQDAVARENASITARATLEMNKSQPLVIARDHTTTINNTQQFYSKDSTPYEEQKQAKQQLRRLAYGL